MKSGKIQAKNILSLFTIKFLIYGARFAVAMLQLNSARMHTNEEERKRDCHGPMQIFTTFNRSRMSFFSTYPYTHKGGG